MKTASIAVNHQELSASLIKQLQMIDHTMRECNAANGHQGRNSLQGTVLGHGVGRYGSRLPRGLRKLANKLCFSHATNLLLRDGARYIYCEGFALRASLGFVVGEHAWVLDRERDWAVVDNTWAQPNTGVYLGIPFSYDFVARCITNGNRVYGVLDRYDLKHPVINEPPENWLHEDAAIIPKDFISHG